MFLCLNKLSFCRVCGHNGIASLRERISHTPHPCSARIITSPEITRAQWNCNVASPKLLLFDKAHASRLCTCLIATAPYVWMVYFSSSARRDRGGGQRPEGLKLCVNKHPLLNARTPPVFSTRKIQGEKWIPRVLCDSIG